MDGNTDRLYVLRRQRGSGLAGTEDCTDASIQGLGRNSDKWTERQENGWQHR